MKEAEERAMKEAEERAKKEAEERAKKEATKSGQKATKKRLSGGKKSKSAHAVKPTSTASSGARAAPEPVSGTSPQASVAESEPRSEQNERINKQRHLFDWKLDEIAASWSKWRDARVQEYWNKYGY